MKKTLIKGLSTILVIALNILTVPKTSAQESVPAELQWYLENNKCGFKDAEGRVVIPARYDAVRQFCGGYAAVNTGMEMKKVKTFPAFASLPAQYEDRMTGGKWGFVDATGKEIVACKYDNVDDFDDGIAFVNMGGVMDFILIQQVEGGKWGMIDTEGKEIIPCIYASISKFHEGLATVNNKGKYGFIDKKGQTVIPCMYNGAGSFIDDRAWVRHKKLYGYIDKTGNQVIALQYKDAESFSDGMAIVSLKDKYGFIDKDGNELIPCQYSAANSFSEGLAAVNIGGKWRDAPDEISAMTGRKQTMIVGGKWGYIDTKGNIVIPLQYEYAEPFKDGKAKVTLDGKIEYISKP